MSGRRPTDDEVDVLVAVTAHAALAMESAQETAQIARHRRALEHLLDVSAKLADKQSVDAILDAVCDAIRDAIGFDRVAVELADHDTGQLGVRASAGCSLPPDRRVRGGRVLPAARAGGPPANGAPPTLPDLDPQRPRPAGVERS